ncbi:MAG: HAMP domain-containing histidine kinase [Gammaproteobacteria bacterium]|jgi:signal transduction histidine kinase|nr:HAMP domain-containing histidine kinase [Gammaproteobacteria bacterium]
MSSAEATLQPRTTVGNTSPTMLQTLLILANLYETDDTDPVKWRIAIESHPRIFVHFLRALTPEEIEYWDESTTTEELRELTLTLLNHPTPIKDDSGNNQRLVETARRLAQITEPALERRIVLTARLLSSGYKTPEQDIAEALQHFARTPAQLHDTHFLTRILAVAWQLTSNDPPLSDCALVLKVSEDHLENLAVSVTAAEHDTEDQVKELHALTSLINLKNTVSRLTQLSSQELALSYLASTFFDSAKSQLFLQSENGWTDGSQHLTSSHSIVATVAESGKPLSTPAHQMTVIDEQTLTNLGANDVLAIPVMMDQTPDSCVAVVLVGLSKSGLMELAGQADLIAGFQTVARAAFSAPVAASIDLEDLNQLTREIIHEANNPLSTVQNYLKVLSLKLGPEHEAQPTIDTISNELYRAASVIGQFQSISSINSVADSCRLNAIVSDQTTLFNQSSETGSFFFDADPNDPEVDISPDGITQAIVNLLKNATESGADSVTIQTTGNLRQSGQRYVEVTVRDNGPGIDSSIDDIFIRGTTTKDGAQRGQGLAIVRNLIQQCGGIVSYRSSTDGTEFRLTIPEKENR